MVAKMIGDYVVIKYDVLYRQGPADRSRELAESYARVTADYKGKSVAVVQVVSIIDAQSRGRRKRKETGFETNIEEILAAVENGDCDHIGYAEIEAAKMEVYAVKRTREKSGEPVIHSHVEDGLPEDHPLAEKQVFCDVCGAFLHSDINKCMRTWVEFDALSVCLKCFAEYAQENDFVLDKRTFKEFVDARRSVARNG